MIPSFRFLEISSFNTADLPTPASPARRQMDFSFLLISFVIHCITSSTWYLYIWESFTPCNSEEMRLKHILCFEANWSANFRSSLMESIFFLYSSRQSSIVSFTLFSEHFSLSRKWYLAVFCMWSDLFLNSSIEVSLIFLQ